MMQDTSNKNQFYVTEDIDAYTYIDNVDNLMDDLFADVEKTLHVDYAKQRSLKPSSQSSKVSAPYASVDSSSSDIVAIAKIEPDNSTSSTSKDTVNISKLNLADISLPPISKQDVLWIQPYIMRNPEPTTDIPPILNSPEVQENNQKYNQKYNLVDRLLLVAACSSALLASVMWTINHGIWLGKQSVSVALVNSQNTSQDKLFTEEISRMLSEITDKNRAIAANPNNAASMGSNIPLIAAPLMNNLQTGTNPFANGMQQPIYVPVYQPPAINTNTPSPLALPPLNANNAIDLSAPRPSNQSGNQLVRNQLGNQSAPTPAPTSVATAPSYTLIGVLDLGDRSTAMLDINGSVRSVGLGKAIDNTGWILFRVNQQEVTLKRGREMKNIFVGQRF